MDNVFDTLRERGFIQQCTHEREIRELLGNERVTFYIGFDPTADSLTIGHFLTIMAMMHLQRAGHRPIALLGGGTGMVGDPSFKTDMRKMMTRETIQHYVDSFKKQMSRYIDFGEGTGGALLVDNADWLLRLEYIPFIREYGVHFSVNRMLAAECYKTRMEQGLTFFEFNYMLMQSYDFLELYRRYGCKLQLGGNDQWSNIIGGVELIRKIENTPAYGMTFTLLETGEGVKMGKTAAGAVWLDPARTSPYDLFQYMRNVDDRDVKKLLSLLTFLPMEEVRRLGGAVGSEINKSKEVLAYEVTKTVHGQEAADEALTAARALFADGAEGGSVPSTEFEAGEVAGGLGIIELLEKTRLITSRSEGRRLIAQGGLRLNGAAVENFERVVTPDEFENPLMIQKGKKIFHRVTVTKR
ncbi:MAG: tyrosine--tRNA ligase [Clostridiales bacterium]|jgi:tyrosyl-tRNA synthetase|nr:tyrosine--tRNA ligase [Clostridiales bacterium]